MNNLVLYILKPRDTLTGSSGTLKYNLTVLEGCLSFFSLSKSVSPKKIEKLLVMKKVLVEKYTPQQARVEIKTQLKLANKPKGKVAKVTIPSDTENINNIVLGTHFG
jgi:hypothetical protein